MKKILFTILLVILIIYSCFFPQITVEASKTGITIWFEQILPALLPFTILSGVLVKSNFLHSFRRKPHLIAFILTMVCGFVFGFPIGAKLSADFYKNNLLTEKQATILAIGTNNFSPMYVSGYVLPTLFGTTQYHGISYLILYFVPLLLILLIYLADYIQTCLHTSMKEQLHATQNHASSDFQLDMETMDDGIIGGFEALIRICGYIVLFSIISDILCRFWNPAPFWWNQLLGNLEITNGIHLLTKNNTIKPVTYVAAVQLLSFGGCSGIAQTASIFGTNPTKKLSIYKYIIGKVILSLFITLLSIIYVFYFEHI